MKIGSLGDIIFEVSANGGRMVTPSEVEREYKARFAEHQVLGAEPRLEFLSPELATMGLPIRLRADMGVDPLAETDRLEALCREGKAHRLIIAGKSYGMFVIEGISQHQSRGSGKGILSVELTLKLKEYF